MTNINSTGESLIDTYTASKFWTVPVTWERTLKIWWSWTWRAAVSFLVFFLIFTSVILFVGGSLLLMIKEMGFSLGWSMSSLGVLLEANPILLPVIIKISLFLALIPSQIYALKKIFLIQYRDFYLKFSPDVPPGTAEYQRNIRNIWWYFWAPTTIAFIEFTLVDTYYQDIYFSGLMFLSYLIACIMILKRILSKGIGTVCLTRQILIREG